MSGGPAAGRSAAPQRNCDLLRLQLCIGQDALAHPSDAHFELRLGIFAAFA